MPTGIYDRTKSKPNTGVFKKGEHRSPVTEFKKGQHLSPATEFKPSIGNGLPNGHGRYNDPEYLMKQSESHKGIGYKKQNHATNSKDTRYKKGVHYSPDTEFKLGQPQLFNPLGSSRPQFSGENHPNWRGGLSLVKSTIRNSGPYHEWRISVFKRDNYTCQLCGQWGGKLNAHHDMPLSKAPLFLLDPSNGKTLCIACHKKIHSKRRKGVKCKRERNPIYRQ